MWSVRPHVPIIGVDIIITSPLSTDLSYLVRDRERIGVLCRTVIDSHACFGVSMLHTPCHMHTQSCVENKHTFLVHTLTAVKALVLVEAELLWRQVSHYPLSGEQFLVFIHCDRSSSSTLSVYLIVPHHHHHYLAWGLSCHLYFIHDPNSSREAVTVFCCEHVNQARHDVCQPVCLYFSFFNPLIQNLSPPTGHELIKLSYLLKWFLKVDMSFRLIHSVLK